MDQEDERSDARAVQEVDGVAAVGEVEVVAGGLVAGDVLADHRAGVDVRQRVQLQLVLPRNDRSDVGAIAQVGEVLAREGAGSGRAEHQAGRGEGRLAVAGDGKALGEGLGAADGVDVVDRDLDAFGVQEAGDGGAELAETDHEGRAAVEDVAAVAQDGLGEEDDGLTDQEVLRVLQRRAGDRDDGTGQLVERHVAAVAVLGVLDDAEDLTGEAAVEVAEGGGVVAADVQQHHRLAGGPGFEVVQGGVGVGEQLAGEGVAGGGLFDRALGGGEDGLRLGQHRP
ncbi:hypothetical protein GCM10010218_27200 [Streptomyces mashuensis]|uniref:Uncharacterized protein n=1 Tax=Streptomyces mashuensis TaxID=33904 RepID=A0A919EDE7_9ACTN|nr:hypothetical protein GCM10010218_27200 [Streptomyces mashuensis]